MASPWRLGLLVLLCLLAVAEPMPKGDGSVATTERSKSKKPGTKVKKKKKPSELHPHVPRSRLHNTAGPVPLERASAKAPGAKPAAKRNADGTPATPTPEDGDLSASERGALLGGLLLAPAGIGGFLLGCSIGGGSVMLYDKVTKGVQKALTDYKQSNNYLAEGGFRSFEELAQLNEVTVKAASEEEALEYKERLQAVLEMPQNRRCFDCTAVAEDAAEWASINLGVFVCPRCAGMHRALGTHKSRIKSSMADVWTIEMIQRMESLGNEKARELYGAAGASRVSKESSEDVLEAHIREKYMKIKPAPGPLPSASGKLYRCSTDASAQPTAQPVSPLREAPAPVQAALADAHADAPPKKAKKKKGAASKAKSSASKAKSKLASKASPHSASHERAAADR